MTIKKTKISASMSCNTQSDDRNQGVGGESGSMLMMDGMEKGNETECNDVVMAVATKKGGGQYSIKFDSLRRTLVAIAIIIGYFAIFISYFVSVRPLLVYLCPCTAPPPTQNLSKMELLVSMAYKLNYW